MKPLWILRWKPYCGRLTLAGHQVPSKLLCHSLPQLGMEEETQGQNKEGEIPLTNYCCGQNRLGEIRLIYYQYYQSRVMRNKNLFLPPLPSSRAQLHSWLSPPPQHREMDTAASPWFSPWVAWESPLQCLEHLLPLLLQCPGGLCRAVPLTYSHSSLQLQLCRFSLLL